MTTVMSFAAPQGAPVAGARDGVRTLLRLEGLALTAIAILLYARSGESFARFALLFLAPDASMLFYIFGRHAGAAAYNAAHSTLGPLALAGLGVAAAQPAALPIALIWLAHIGFDRVLGYGLKHSSDFRDTHLGRIGK
jgi:hypothetical protein